MAGGAENQAAAVLERDAVGAGALEVQREALGIRRQLAVTGALVFQAHPVVTSRFTFTGAFALIREADRLTGRAETLRRAHSVAGSTAFDEDFLAGLDPIGSAIAGEHAEQVTAWLVGCRQVDQRTALAVGADFAAGQLDRELTEVLQLVVDHRQLLGTQAQLHLGIDHRLAVRVEQHQSALDRLASAEVRFVEIQRHFEVRLDVLGDAKGAAVQLVAVSEAQLIAAGHGVVRQLEAALAATGAVEVELLGLQYGAVGIQHAEADRRSAGGHRVAGILELTADDLHFHPVAGAIQRAVGEGVQLGVVDFAVVIEVLGDEHAALGVLADHVGALRAGMAEAQQALCVGLAAGHHAQAIAPQQLRASDRRALVLVGRPHKEFATGDLAHRHGVGNEHHGGGAVLADDRLGQVQAGLQFAQRHVDVARGDADEVARRAGQVNALGRLDRLGFPQRVTELGHQRQALHRRELHLRGVFGGRGDGAAHLQLRRLFGDLLARLVGERSLHYPTGFAVPVVPQVRQGVGQPLALELALRDHAVQVLLALEEFQRLLDAVQAHIHAAVAFHAIAAVITAWRLEAHRGHFIGGEARVGKQEERLAGQRRVAARRHVILGLGSQGQQGQQRDSQ